MAPRYSKPERDLRAWQKRNNVPVGYRGGRRRRRPAQKKFQLQRPKARVARQVQPILETKKYVGFRNGATLGPGAAYMTTTNASLVLIPNAFMYMKEEGTAGLPINSGVQGNDVFSRYLTEKLLIEYPATSYAPSDTQVRPMELIWGWCKPLNLTAHTTPARNTCIRGDLINHVLHQVAEDFDQTQDSMLFNDKKKRSYNIIGRKKLKPNQNGNVIGNSWVPDDATKLRGGPAPMRRNITWKMNKKVELTKSADTGSSTPNPDPVDPFMYPNQAYIPFIILYNPDFAKYTENAGGKISQIKVTRNSCHWFNDA
jgi:hypothetical protein